MHFERVLASVDYSRNGHIVLEYALAFARTFRLRLALLQIGHRLGEIQPDNHKQKEALLNLSSLLSDDERHILRPEFIVISDDSEKEGIRAIGNNPADIVVINNDESSLLDEIPIAVLSVGNEARMPPRFGHILIATDLSEVSKQSLRQAMGLMHRANANVLMVNAVEVGVEGGAEAATYLSGPRLGDSRKKLQEFRAEFADSGIDLETIALEGPASRVIIDAAERYSANLIVMGKTELALVTDEVFNNPRIPVLAVPVPERASSEFIHESNVA